MSFLDYVMFILVSYLSVVQIEFCSCLTFVRVKVDSFKYCLVFVVFIFIVFIIIIILFYFYIVFGPNSRPFP